MKLHLYITASIITHALFLGLLVTIRPAENIALPAISVRIADPARIDQVPDAQEKKEEPPAVVKRKPLLTKRPPRVPEDKEPPDTLHSKDIAVPPEDLSTKKADEQSIESGLPNTDRDSSSLELSDAKDSSPESKGPSFDPYIALFDKKVIEKYAKKGLRSKQGLSFDTSEFKNRGYMRMLKDKIESIWKYPKEAARLGISGDLYIKFSIKRDGMLNKVELIRTSGYRALDEAAMKALRDAEPYWPLPDDWDGDILEINGHFIYIYGTTFIM